MFAHQVSWKQSLQYKSAHCTQWNRAMLSTHSAHMPISTCSMKCRRQSLHIQLSWHAATESCVLSAQVPHPCPPMVLPSAPAVQSVLAKKEPKRSEMNHSTIHMHGTTCVHITCTAMSKLSWNQHLEAGRPDDCAATLAYIGLYSSAQSLSQAMAKQPWQKKSLH